MSKKKQERKLIKEQKQKQRLIKKQERKLIKEQKQKQRLIKKQEQKLIKEQKLKQRLIKKQEKKLIKEQKQKQRLIKKQQPEQKLIKEQQQQQKLIKEQQQQQKLIKEQQRSEVSIEYLNYKNKMDKQPNDTVLSRWGMYSHDERYKDYTANIVNMIKQDMNINTDQAYYMLYYMVSNNITDYERAKADMHIDENFEMYSRKKKKKGI